ncbi:Protein SAD1/UNC-84 domain protein 1 [Striga hermonthica]|uniref:Protein SAD1/UNC-84 domain protein 1 n=1 Tax=Striga hermonthica TaxID=68872 RepID=A0A9N7N6P5_STRHE|nr:Protein SAD1/UNC-84 domain protein 1 [Striga hermonthica]
MSASTVSITANQGPTTRRRAAEKNISAADSGFAAATIVTESENRDDRPSPGDTAVARDARKVHTHIPTRKSAPSRKPAKPRWLTVISILTKNLALLVVILGFVQMTRWVVLNSGPDAEDILAISGYFEGKYSEMEKFVRTTVKEMQVQLNVYDQKFEDGLGSVRKEFDEKIEKKGNELDIKLKALGARNDVFEKFMDGFRNKNFLLKEEFGEFYEEFLKARNFGDAGGLGKVSLDELKNYAQEIVAKEIGRHAADGLGMVDYALASGGGRVVRHSEPYGVVRLSASTSWLMNRNRVSAEAEKLIRPSFGEPGQCFPLKGQNGFVNIKLRTAIVPEAVTLEHVAKSVAYDRSSAPKHCRVSGWMQGQDLSDLEVQSAKMFPLAEFTYDLEKSNVQTFNVKIADSNLVDTIRLDVISNHGSASHTCIYRLRVHGRELSPNHALEMQA